MKLGVLAEPILIGRKQEITELLLSLDSALEQKGGTVFISGEAGSGKTKLVNEFLNIVKEKEITILSGWCLSDVAVPYFPFMEAFDAYFEAKNSTEKEPARHPKKGRPDVTKQRAYDENQLKSWLAGTKPAAESRKPQDLSPQAWQDLTLATVTKTLLSISTKKPVVLFIDDLHWADSASLSLLHYISRAIRSSRILVLATFRSEELNPDEEGHPHPLLKTLRLMKREYLFKEIKLPNLSADEVATLTEKMMGGRLNPELAEKLAKGSQGNPLFVVESLRMLSENRSLIEEAGQWRLSIDEFAIPNRIRDIILRRVGMLKPNQRRILDLASVIGDKFEVELLGSVLDQDNLVVLETLNAISQSSSLVCCEGSFYRFDHDKSREVIYGELSEPLKNGYHARIAEKIEAKSGVATDIAVSDLAYHYAQAGNKEKAAEYALAAGADALARFSNSEAIKHYNYVLNTISGSESATMRATALEGRGDALEASGFFVEAVKTFEDLTSFSESDILKLRALRKALVCSYWLGDRAHSIEIAAKGEKYAQSDRLEYARLRLYRGFVYCQGGRIREGLDDMGESLRVFEEDCSLQDVANALVEISFSYREDRLQESVVAALRSIAIYEELRDLRRLEFAYSRLGTAFYKCGFFQKARDSYLKAIKIGEKVGDYNKMAFHFYMLGRVTIDSPREAVTQILKGAEYAERTEAHYVQSLCYTHLVIKYARLGEVELAEEFGRKLEKLLNEVVSLRTNPQTADGALTSKAFLLTLRGKWKEANEILEKMIATNSEDLWRTETSLRAAFAWSLEKQGRTEEAKVQLEEARKIREASARRLKSQHGKIQAYLMAKRDIGVSEELDIRLDIVNVGMNNVSIVRVEGLIPPALKPSELPSYCNVQNGSIEMGGKGLESFAVEPVKLSLQATKAGVFTLEPQVIYIDAAGEIKTCKTNPVTVTVRPMLHAKIGEETISVPILPGRVATGFTDLDALLYGGIPAKYAVILVSPSNDERTSLIKDFLETGASAGEPTFLVTAEAETSNALAEKFPACFFLMLCNPQADFVVQSLPNVYKLKGVENLTEIDIALTKAFRTLNPSATSPRRICIEVVSDVLLQHHAVTTRRWLSSLLPTLKTKGFTTLAVMDPLMHPPEEVQAVLGLFDGEIRATERETAKGAEKVLKIRKLSGQKYLEKELTLNKETFLP